MLNRTNVVLLQFVIAVEVMDLLLSINNFGYSTEEAEKVTLVMVTHNPDLECYADRIIYLADGAIVK